MNQQNEGSSSAPAKTAKPANRKRGRPRKDDGPSQGKIPTVLLPGSDGVKSHQLNEVPPSRKNTDVMVGQPVSGVVEASFDAGYFLSVRVGNTDTILRGVVFQPGRFTPISEANDVAPNARMYKRRNVPLPVGNPLNSSNYAQPVTPVLVPFKFFPISVSMGAPVTPQQAVDPSSDPSVAVNLTNDSGIILGENVVLQKSLEPEVVMQQVSQLDQTQAVGKSHNMQDLKVSPLKVCNMDMEMSKDLNVDISSKALAKEGDGAEFDLAVTEDLNLDSAPKSIELVGAESKMPNLELQLTPIMEKKGFLENASSPQDVMQLELPGEVPKRVETCENGKKVMIMQEETAVFQPEKQAEGSVHQVMGIFDSQIPTSQMQSELPGEVPKMVETCENGKKVMIMQEEAAVFQPEKQAEGSVHQVMGIFDSQIPTSQMQSDLPGEVLKRVETCENGKKVMIMQEEAAVFQPEKQAEGSVHQVMDNSDSQIPSSSDAIGNMDYVKKDASSPPLTHGSEPDVPNPQDGNTDCTEI